MIWSARINASKSNINVRPLADGGARIPRFGALDHSNEVPKLTWQPLTEIKLGRAVLQQLTDARASSDPGLYGGACIF
jgi:hypothetical protein